MDALSKDNVGSANAAVNGPSGSADAAVNYNIHLKIVLTSFKYVLTGSVQCSNSSVRGLISKFSSFVSKYVKRINKQP